MRVVAVALIAIMAGLAGCATPPAERPLPFFDLQTVAFFDRGEIPTRFTCDGENVSMSLSWAHEPNGTTHYALVMDDPDAGKSSFIHWTWWDLPVNQRAIPRDADVTLAGAREGRTSFGEVGYGSPCPPAGENHRYYVTVYALDGPLNLASGSPYKDVKAAIGEHAIGKAVVMGKYARLAP
jgi:Raf kinase inhibitor-like YbhB/YbcL family protein